MADTVLQASLRAAFNSKLGKTEKAASATTADSATTAATADKLSVARTISLTGNAAGSTSFDGSTNVNLNVTSATDSSKILITGARGTLAGYEQSSTLSGSQTITTSSPDEIEMSTSGSITLTFTAGAAGTCTTKVISLTATGTTTLTISGAVWANAGEAPTWGTSGKHLVLVAHFVGQRVILNVFDNDQQ